MRWWGDRHIADQPHFLANLHDFLKGHAIVQPVSALAFDGPDQLPERFAALAQLDRVEVAIPFSGHGHVLFIRLHPSAAAFTLVRLPGLHQLPVLKRIAHGALQPPKDRWRIGWWWAIRGDRHGAGHSVWYGVGMPEENNQRPAGIVIRGGASKIRGIGNDFGEGIDGIRIEDRNGLSPSGIDLIGNKFNVKPEANGAHDSHKVNAKKDFFIPLAVTLIGILVAVVLGWLGWKT